MLNSLIDFMVECYEFNKSIGVVVTTPDSDIPEIIIIHRENIPKKVDYYIKAYNDDCSLKANSNVRIVDWFTPFKNDNWGSINYMLYKYSGLINY